MYLHRTFITAAADGTLTVRAPAPAEQRTAPALPRITGFPTELVGVGRRRRGAAPGADAAPSTAAGCWPTSPTPTCPVTGAGGRTGTRRSRSASPGSSPPPASPRPSTRCTSPALATATPASCSLAWPPMAGWACSNRACPPTASTARLRPRWPPTPPRGGPSCTAPPATATWTSREALTGDPARLGNLPGGGQAHRAPASALVTALWPALWGFTASQVFDVARGREPASWAGAALFPEGAYPAVRVGPQPYGLLPTTAWTLWQADDGDPALEVPLVKALLVLRAQHAASARARGTAAGQGHRRAARPHRRHALVRAVPVPAGLAAGAVVARRGQLRAARQVARLRPRLDRQVPAGRRARAQPAAPLRDTRRLPRHRHPARAPGRRRGG